VVVAVPEGLPLAVTLTYESFTFYTNSLKLAGVLKWCLFDFSLAYSMRKMMRDKALVMHRKRLLKQTLT
jgi:hypothetical protein